MGHSTKPKMPEKTLEALKQSIDNKWKRIVRSTKVEDLGRSDCALCGLFLEGMNNCSGCPVYEKTKRTLCHGTPYKEWYNHHRDIHHLISRTREPGCKECLRLAKAERDFLISLLPR